MNASPANLNPVNPVQTHSAAGKPQDSASDTPFSQVLSSEIAQNQRSQEARKGPDTKTESEAASQPADSTEAGAPPIAKATEKEDPSIDPLQSDFPATPDALLALAMHPDQLPPTPASADGTQPRQSAAWGAHLPSTLEGRNVRLPQTLPGKPLLAETAGTQKIDPSQLQTLSGKPLLAETAGAQKTDSSQPKARPGKQLVEEMAGGQKPDPSQPSKLAAAAFAGQLAAIRQSDSMKAGEQPSDLMANPLMRATPDVPVETPTPLSGAAANRLAPSVGATAWGQALGEKMVWMAAGSQQTASLTLNPPNLGPLQIVLNIANDQATAIFFSAQPEVRQALEAAFPRLREMMNEAGIQLGQATVSADTPQQHASDQQSQRVVPLFSGVDETSPAGLQTVQSPVPRSGRGLVDTFA